MNFTHGRQPVVDAAFLAHGILRAPNELWKKLAITVVCEPSNAAHPKQNPQAWSEYRRYVASISGPKVVVVQDLDKPHVIGAFWGEVNSNMHRALGCTGTITDGAIRDLEEMAYAGSKP